ncbi:hypothetical protein B7494_g5102 [Chlorociboria aeruginascens]|nr:hypothetical protein B7494_g5102 [Chlorociboria aeruginascens]
MFAPKTHHPPQILFRYLLSPNAGLARTPETGERTSYENEQSALESIRSPNYGPLARLNPCMDDPDISSFSFQSQTLRPSKVILTAPRPLLQVEVGNRKIPPPSSDQCEDNHVARSISLGLIIPSKEVFKVIKKFALIVVIGNIQSICHVPRELYQYFEDLGDLPSRPWSLDDVTCMRKSGSRENDMQPGFLFMHVPCSFGICGEWLQDPYPWQIVAAHTHQPFAPPHLNVMFSLFISIFQSLLSFFSSKLPLLAMSPPSMKTWTVTEPYLNIHCSLGEGPSYEPATHTLRFVDIKQKRFHSIDLSVGPDSLKTIQFDMPIGVTADIEGVDPQKKILVGGKDGLYILDREKGTWKLLRKFFGQEDKRRDERLRSNDGSVDPHGRFWLGTMDDFWVGEPQAEGTLFLIDSSLNVTSKRKDLTIPNSIGWSLDHKTMFFTHSTEKRIIAFDYSPSGQLTNERVFWQHDGSGDPDGFKLDAEGNIWQAVYGESRVLKISPEGNVVGEIKYPSKCITCPVFVGTELWVTTATDNEGFGGEIFKVDVGVEGVESFKFKFDEGVVELPPVSNPCHRSISPFSRESRCSVRPEPASKQGSCPLAWCPTLNKNTNILLATTVHHANRADRTIRSITTRAQSTTRLARRAEPGAFRRRVAITVITAIAPWLKTTTYTAVANGTGADTILTDAAVADVAAGSAVIGVCQFVRTAVSTGYLTVGTASTAFGVSIVENGAPDLTFYDPGEEGGQT